ncbi:MAG: addiction module protein [Phaeodactylibacter sp.]|nr:addiction module protein [Phaeodactylibacter sp.]
MSKDFENILEQVHQLTRSEQLALIASIARMLSDDEPDVLPEYIVQENNRRLAAYDAGKTKGIPYKEALNSVREQISRNKF